MVDVYFAKLADDVIIPSKREEDAGFDIYPHFSGTILAIEPHQTVMVPTGLKSAFPAGYGMFLYERGSTGTKGIGQRCGVIDSGYRGEWMVPITNHNDRLLFIVKEGTTIDVTGDPIIYPYEKAICQAVLHELPPAAVKEVSPEAIDAMTSERGTGKLGSSGK